MSSGEPPALAKSLIGMAVASRLTSWRTAVAPLWVPVAVLVPSGVACLFAPGPPVWVTVTLWTAAAPFLLLYLAAAAWGAFKDPSLLRTEPYLLEEQRLRRFGVLPEAGDRPKMADVPPNRPSPLTALLPDDDS